MAHSEKRADPVREFQLAVVGGSIYGASHTLSGHSLDNIKVITCDQRHHADFAV